MPKYQKRRNYKKKKFVKRRKRMVKRPARKTFKKKVEMIKLSEGTNDCQAITPVFHNQDGEDWADAGHFMTIPKEIYYTQTSKKNTIGSQGPSLGSRITGNSVFSKYLNFRFRLRFMSHTSGAFPDASNATRIGRYRVLAGVFHDAPACAVPWLGWISDQGGPTSPEICDSDFEGVQWKAEMTNQLQAFYNGEYIWGGLTEKRRWTLIHDKVYKSKPVAALQYLSGQTSAINSDGEGDSKSLVSGPQVFTRPDIEGYIDFSKMKCCNKKLFYGPNVISAQAADHALNEAFIYNPTAVGDRGLASTTARDVPFVYVLNMEGEEEDLLNPDLSYRWVHYFQDA